MSSFEIWIIICFIGAILFLFKTLINKYTGFKLNNSAKKLATTENWELAIKTYKAAILEQLDSYPQLQKLTSELSQLYESKGHSIDFSDLLNCPDLIMNTESCSYFKKIELIDKIYKEAGTFLDSLPGPKIND
jgi:hypothetical protein